MKFAEVGGKFYEAVDEWPSSLKSLEQTAEAVHIDVDTLRNQVRAMQVPHYVYPNGEPAFRISDVKRWMLDTGQLRKAQPYVVTHRVVNYNANPLAEGAIPESIQHIKGLKNLSTYPPGIYFLVDGDEVVYVGQSMHPATRLKEHDRDGRKTYTHAFLLPTPESDLNDLETLLIAQLRPKFNAIGYQKHSEKKQTGK